VADKDNKKLTGLLALGIIWLIGQWASIWFALDHSVPAWDQADYLTGSLTIGRLYNSPRFSNEWWTSFYFPLKYLLTYVATAVQNLWDRTRPSHTNQSCYLVQFYWVWLIDWVQLFSVKVGLYSAMPSVSYLVLSVPPGFFFTGLSLTAFVTFSFCCLTVWRDIGTAKEAEAQSQMVVGGGIWPFPLG